MTPEIELLWRVAHPQNQLGFLRYLLFLLES